MITSKDTDTNCRRLQGIHEEIQEWASRHGVTFAPQKYELIHFYPREMAHRAPEGEWEKPVFIQNQGRDVRVEPKGCARYLGVWLDSQLTGETHLKEALKKGNQQKEALRGITGAAWGANPQQMVRLYKATVLPRIAYGCSTWITQQRGWGYKKYWNRAQTKLKAFQKGALAAIPGAFRSTAGQVLDVEFNVEPITAYMAKTALITTNRIRSSPTYQRMLEIRGAGAQTA